MSHNVNLKGVRIKDTIALKQACEELARDGAKVSLNMDARNFRTYRGQDTACDGAIIMGTGQHDIGLKKQPDGSYQPVYDPYGFSADLNSGRNATNFCPTNDYDQQQAAKVIGKLLQRYGVVVTERAAAQQGKSYVRTTDAKTGVVELTISA